MSLAQDLLDAIDAVAASDAGERARQQANSDMLQAIIDSLQANPTEADVAAAIAKLGQVKADSDATLASLPPDPDPVPAKH